MNETINLCRLAQEIRKDADFALESLIEVVQLVEKAHQLNGQVQCSKTIEKLEKLHNKLRPMLLRQAKKFVEKEETKLAVEAAAVGLL
jgi:hypothetical protein